MSTDCTEFFGQFERHCLCRLTEGYLDTIKGMVNVIRNLIPYILFKVKHLFVYTTYNYMCINK